MGRKHSIQISNRLLGTLLIVALFIQFILPQAGINFLNSIPTLIYLIVAIYLFIVS